MVCWKANICDGNRIFATQRGYGDYPNFHLTMHCYICKVKSGKLTLLEHEAAKWLTRDELSSVKWLPEDEEVVENIIK
ncbi:hypothetical protein [uncultured Prevotella sp.]|uniref:hypothetical protein n=1 Tax=uncultured Prevotella sp. TaxID=159272 RepID=UPI0027E3A7F3|nr:hypothetical protein [uncultured Prevotella sp.]